MKSLLVTLQVMVCLIIDRFCRKIAAEKVDTKSVAETIEPKRLVVEVVAVHEADRVALIDWDNTSREIVLR